MGVPKRHIQKTAPSAFCENSPNFWEVKLWMWLRTCRWLQCRQKCKNGTLAGVLIRRYSLEWGRCFIHKDMGFITSRSILQLWSWLLIVLPPTRIPQGVMTTTWFPMILQNPLFCVFSPLSRNKGSHHSKGWVPVLVTCAVDLGPGP